MNLLVSENVRMTSLEIAELTGKLHKNIMADIRKEIKVLGNEVAGLIFKPSKYQDKNNQERPCYEFGKNGAMQLALKYDAKTRYKVIERIEELENNALPMQLAKEIARNEEAVRYIGEQVAKINAANNEFYDKANEKLETIDKKIEGEYVTPQDLDAINYAIKFKAEKFVDEAGVQITIDSVLAGDIYEQAQASKKAKEERKYTIGKVKRQILVAVKKHLGMKGNAPNNHIKRKDVDLAIQFIKQVKQRELV